MIENELKNRLCAVCGVLLVGARRPTRLLRDGDSCTAIGLDNIS